MLRNKQQAALTSVASAAPRDLPAEWAHLRAWLASTNDPLRPWNIAAVGALAGLSKQQAKALLNPSPDKQSTRTAATSERLAAVVAMLSKPPFNYSPD